MKIEQHFENVVSYVKQHHRWTVPAVLLLLSHLLFSAGGPLTGLVSLPLSYGALVYYARFASSNGT